MPRPTVDSILAMETTTLRQTVRDLAAVLAVHLRVDRPPAPRRREVRLLEAAGAAPAAAVPAAAVLVAAVLVAAVLVAAPVAAPVVPRGAAPAAADRLHLAVPAAVRRLVAVLVVDLLRAAVQEAAAREAEDPVVVPVRRPANARLTSASQPARRCKAAMWRHASNSVAASSVAAIGDATVRAVG